jgi:hypothetical protein
MRGSAVPPSRIIDRPLIVSLEEARLRPLLCCEDKNGVDRPRRYLHNNTTKKGSMAREPSYVRFCTPPGCVVSMQSRRLQHMYINSGTIPYQKSTPTSAMKVHDSQYPFSYPISGQHDKRGTHKVGEDRLTYRKIIFHSFLQFRLVLRPSQSRQLLRSYYIKLVCS